MTEARRHVAVIGAGVTGSAVAFFLAEAGLAVSLIEPDGPGAHASANNPGNLNPILHTPAALRAFALESFRLHLSLAQRLQALGSNGYDLAPVRRILLAFDAQDEAGFENILREFEDEAGFSARPVDRQTLREWEPRLAEIVRGGLLLSGNMSVDSQALTRALAESARRLGTNCRSARVSAIESAAGRVTSLRAGAEDIACDAVVLATGPWVKESETWLGISLPVQPVKGQMLRLVLPGPEIAFDLTHREISLYRRKGSEIWLGVTIEPGCLDEQPTQAGYQRLMAGAERIFPGIARARLLHHSAAVRPQGPAGYPLLGRAAAWENVFVANGAGAKGVLLAAGMAQAIADLILRGDSALPIALQTFQ